MGLYIGVEKSHLLSIFWVRISWKTSEKSRETWFSRFTRKLYCFTWFFTRFLLNSDPKLDSKVICWISLAWPNLAYFYFAMAELGPFLFCLGPAWLSLVLVISLSQCTGACWEFPLEFLKLPFNSVAQVRRIIVQILLKFSY